MNNNLQMHVLFILLSTIIFNNILAQSPKPECDSLYFQWNANHKEFIINEPLPELIGGMEKFYELISYPDSALTAGIEGTVLVWFIVDKNGKPKCLKIVKSVGYGCDQVVFEAVQKSKFKPVKIRGNIYETGLLMPVHFKLNNQQKFSSKVISFLKSIFKQGGHLTTSQPDVK